MLEIPQEIKKTLTEIGLDRTEIQVYFLLLKKNLLSIQEITNELKLPRSSVHLACESMLNTGVMKISTSGKRRLFYIEGPKAITNFLENKESELQKNKLTLNSILPKLSAIHSASQEIEPIEIEELQGEDGFVETFYRSLDQPKGGEVLRFGADPTSFTIAREKLKKYREDRMKKKIFTKLLLPDSEFSKEEIGEAKFKMRETRILSKDKYSPQVQASIWSDQFSITIWDKGLHSIIIRNKFIALFMKQLFEIAWNNPKK